VSEPTTWREVFVEIAMRGRHAGDHLYGLTPLPIGTLVAIAPAFADLDRRAVPVSGGETA
jgi:hypothetical protein